MDTVYDSPKTIGFYLQNQSSEGAWASGTLALLSWCAQREGAVEDGGFRCVVEVGAVVAEALELVAVAGLCASERGF